MWWSASSKTCYMRRHARSAVAMQLLVAATTAEARTAVRAPVTGVWLVGGAVGALGRCAGGVFRVGLRVGAVVGRVEEPTKTAELVDEPGDVGVFGGM